MVKLTLWSLHLMKERAVPAKERDCLDWAKLMEKNIVAMDHEAFKKSSEDQYGWLVKRVDLLK